MSKRSSRRFAVVTGVALALGSMAPALAGLSADVDGDSDATVDISDVTLPSAGSLIPGGLITDLRGTAFETVGDVRGVALNTAGGVRNDVSELVSELLGAASGLSLDVDADANANSNGGGATVQVSGVGNGAGDVLDLVPAPGEAVDGALGLAAPVAGIGLGLADKATDLATGAPGMVLGAGGGLLGTGLGLIDGVSLSGDANVIASLLASF